MSTRTKRMILIAAVLVFVAALIYSVWSILSRKNTVELYLEAEKKKFGEFVGNIEKQYTSLKSKYQPYMEQAYSSRTELSLDISGGLDSFGLGDAGVIEDILGKTKLIVKTKSDPVKGISATDADLLLEKAPFLKARLYSDPQTIWLSVPDFLPDRYFSVQRKDLVALYDRFSIPVKPQRLISGREIAASISFGGKTFRESADKLAEIWSGYLTDETVIDNGARIDNIGGTETEGREIMVTLDEEKATSLLKDMLTAIADDDALLEYTYGSLANISELLDDAGLFRLFSFMGETETVELSDYEREILTKLNIRKDMEGFRQGLKKTAETYRLRDGFKMHVMLDNDENIVSRRVSLDFLDTTGGASGSGTGSTAGGAAADGSTDDAAGGATGGAAADSSTGGGSFKVDIAVSENTAGYRSARLTLAEYGPGGADSVKRVTELSVESVMNEVKDSQKEGRIDIVYSITEDGEKTQIDIGIDVSDKIDEKTMKRITGINAEADISGAIGGNISAAIKNTSWSNKKLKKNNSTTEIKVDADLPFLGISGFSAAMDIADEDVFGIEEFSLPDFGESAVMDLYAASDEDIDMLEIEIMASFGTFYLENRYIFDALLGW